MGEAKTGASDDGPTPVGAYEPIGIFVVVFTILSTGTEVGTFVASIVGSDVGVCEVGTIQGGSVTCTVGTGTNVIDGVGPILGAIVGSMVGTGGTLME